MNQISLKGIKFMFNKLEEYQNSKLERLVLDGNDLS